MLSHDDASSASAPVTRRDRVEALLEQLRGNADATLRQMAERLVDLPEDQSFGQIELDLRDLAHDLASSSHRAGLAAGKKRATEAPASPAPAAAATPASSATARRPG
jgi:hypothetical protein